MTFKTTKSDVMILSPIFFSGVGGAAIYYRMLSNALLDEGVSVSVVSDAEHGQFAGRYYGLLPKRAGRDTNRAYNYFSYAYQNLAYFRLMSIVSRETPGVLLVHSSFYNYPGIFPRILQMVKQANKNTRFVVDVRDRLMPKGKIPFLRLFDRIIACSENVRAHLKQNGGMEKDIDLIPVIQNPIVIDEQRLANELSSHGLSQNGYILYVGAVKEEKAVDLLLKAYVRHVRPLKPDLALVIVGLMKTESPEVKQLLRALGVRYLGNLPRSSVLSLMAGARVCVNLSPCEGMPRVSLEALALGKPVVLPPNVPEFKEHCPEFVESSTDPEVVADRIFRTINDQAVPLYPISSHDVSVILPRYMEILKLAN